MRSAIALVLAASVALVACDEGIYGPKASLTYQVVEGACGEVVFVESLGADSASAMSTLEDREAAQYPQWQVVLQPYRLEVVDEQDVSPEPAFYAVRVIDVDTGVSVHSVSDVFTTDGDLFALAWCPD